MALCELDRINYFIDIKRKSDYSTFQQVFYLIKPQKTALTLGCSLYLMIFEDLLFQFDDEVMRSIYDNSPDKRGINISKKYIPAHSKVKILRRFNKPNSEFVNELDMNLRNCIAHFDFKICNRRLCYKGKSITKKELREKTKKIFFLDHMILLNKELAIRECILKTF